MNRDKLLLEAFLEHHVNSDYLFIDETTIGRFLASPEYKDGWISVEDELPESGQCVLLYSPKSGVGEGAWLSDKGYFEQWRWNTILTNVTHWMPLPEPPKSPLK